MTLDLTTVKGLFFDVYATLIDWEAGIMKHLSKLLERSKMVQEDTTGSANYRTKTLKSFHEHSIAIWTKSPTLPYPQVNEQVFAAIAGDLGAPFSREEQIAFGASIGDWPAFSDTVEALQTLGKHYKLFVLSNVDNASFERTRTGPLKGFKWDAVYTAEDIGSYKPDPRNYEYVLERAEQDFGIGREEIVLVAQSLDIDHAMNKKLGFKPGVYIARSGSSMNTEREVLERKGVVEIGAAYDTLGDFADAVRLAFENRS